MKVRDLQILLANAAPDTEVLIEDGDHGYRRADFTVTTALRAPDGDWTEDHGEKLTPEAEYGRRLPAVVVS